MRAHAVAFAALCILCCAGVAERRVQPAAQPSSASPVPSASPAGAPTQPPITVSPVAATVAVGFDTVVHVGGVIAPIGATLANAAIANAAVDQSGQTITLTGKAPGTTTLTITDRRGLTAVVPVRVAYTAGSVADGATIRITGDPASAQFVKYRAVEAARNAARVRPGAALVATTDAVTVARPLAPDDIATVDVPVLIQGSEFITAEGKTRVRVYNVAAPKITPNVLMVSDYPERLESNGVLFTADLKYEAPSRFLYFHYNPAGASARRIVLRADNASAEPALVQFIGGQGGPGPNEMEVGHTATRRFLENEVQNQGLLIEIPAGRSTNVVEQDMPPNSIVSNLMQMRVLNGSAVHLTLFAQDATASPEEPVSSAELLSGGHAHARGIYSIPEFRYSALWNTTGPYLQFTIGQLPLTNSLAGEALSGDYGVKQTFVVKVENPMPTPQNVAIYESPRGGRATGTYLIDGVLVQSHQTPAFSRYKIRQYVVPAKGFVRVTIATYAEAGSSYPLQLIFAPDDGSVAPGAPGSPIY